MIMGYSIKAYLSETRMASRQVFFTHNLSLYTHSHLRRKRFGRHEMNFSLYLHKDCMEVLGGGVKPGRNSGTR